MYMCGWWQTGEKRKYVRSEYQKALDLVKQELFSRLSLTLGPYFMRLGKGVLGSLVVTCVCSSTMKQ